MTRSIHAKLRGLLRAAEDGLTVADMAVVSGHAPDAVRTSLLRMPDAYIDRYSAPVRGQHPAVWCVVVPPPHCPRPTSKATRRPSRGAV